MAFLPDVKSLEKLLGNDWKTFLYGAKSETWDDRFYYVAKQIWNQIFMFLESQGRKFINYWALYAAFCVASFIVLATYKSLRYVGTIKLRKSDKCERQVKKRISGEGSRIISDDGNNDTSNLLEKPCPTSRSDLENDTAAVNDFPDSSRRDSSVSSDTTIVAFEEKQSGEFLKNFINSIEPGNDAMDHNNSTKQSSKDAEEKRETSDFLISTREKVNSNNCKHFYHLTPWIGTPENQESSTPTENILSSSAVSADDMKLESSTHDNLNSSTADPEEIKKIEWINLDPANPSSPKLSTSKTLSTEAGKSSERMTNASKNATLAIEHESSSVCCADDVLTLSNNEEKNCPTSNNEKSCEVIVQKMHLQCNDDDPIINNIMKTLPELDLSPISKGGFIEIDEIKIENSMNTNQLEIRTDSKHRFRSLSHDNRTVSCAGYVDTRRGCSVSPPARTRTKNIKSRPVKQTQSKIPTPSLLAQQRQINQQLGTDETVAETANHIRSVLLRKLKEVWVHHSRDRTPSPNRSMKSSQNSSIYYTPEGVSKIPLLRRSPRRSDTNDQTRSPRLSRNGDRSSNESEESRLDYSEKTDESNFPVGVTAVFPHSTPKTSPLGRIQKR